MTTLHSLKGIEGYRWGLLFKKNGSIERSSDAPAEHSAQFERLRQLLELLPPEMDSVDLTFDLGQLLLRTGPEGRLLLVCDRVIKITAVNLMASDLLKKGAKSTSFTSLSDTDSQMSMVRTISFGEKVIPAHVIDELIALFTQTLGPLAPHLAQMIARKRDLDLKSIQEKDWSNLLNALAAQIDHEEKREKFLDAAVTLKNKF